MCFDSKVAPRMNPVLSFPIIFFLFQRDIAGCPMLLIFLPSFLVSLCFPGLKVCQRLNLPCYSCLQCRVLVLVAVPKELLFLPPPVSGLRLELLDTLNYCVMPHAAPGNWNIIALFLHPSDTGSQVICCTVPELNPHVNK